MHNNVRMQKGNNEKKKVSFKRKNKFKPKYDSRIHLLKQRTIQKQRAEFASRIHKQKTGIGRTETIQPTFNKPRGLPNVLSVSSKPFESSAKLVKDVPDEKISSMKSQSIRRNKNNMDKKKSNDPQPISGLYSLNNTKEVWFDDVPQALIASSTQDQSATTKSLVKLASFAGPTRRIAMDCEFVGVGFEGKDDALARVSIVNQFGHTLLDTFVRPEERVVDYRTRFSGIRPRDLRKNGPARSFTDVHKEVAELIKNKILVGHSILKDLKVLRLSHPRRLIRDTSRYRPFRDLFSGRIPSLKALTQKVLGVNVQIGEHDSVEDARATMRLYTSVKRVWESSKKHRVKTSKQIKNINLEEKGVLNIKDEYENPMSRVH
ncbi:RNA exonuclease 4 [Schistosoma japonicum]|nr:RNA exonuclease 4 [Schistosoma japonicum]